MYSNCYLFEKLFCIGVFCCRKIKLGEEWTQQLISVQGLAFRWLEVSILKHLPAGRKAYRLYSDAGGIRQIGHDGHLCLPGRFDL
jgi:hypothetical protein